MTPLLGADGQTYAIAQGNLLVGGLGVEGVMARMLSSMFLPLDEFPEVLA